MNLTYLFLIILTALWFIVFLYFRWYIKKRTSVKEQLKEYRSEVDKLNAEIDRITDRDAQIIEDRVKKLKEILDDTDKRISAYANEMANVELEKIHKGDSLYTNLGRGIRDALKTEKPEPPLSTVHPQELSSLKSSSSVQKAPEAPVKKEALPTKLPAAPVSKTPSKRQIRSAIDQLLNEGHTPEQVASRLEISLAEVNLAVRLRRKN